LKSNPTITFIVLTYNHAGCALEHLESIANLIRKYNQIKIHDLVISDDASQDSTVPEVSLWLKNNYQIFLNVTTYFSSENVGTCQSFLRATKCIKTTHIKATGGDDIFSELKNSGGADIVGSQPLILIDDELYRFHKINLIYAIANSVYANGPFKDQLVGHGSIYTAGLIYSKHLICDERIRGFISKCLLVEDFATWIAITEHYPSVTYRISKVNLVYYRRTQGSAYLIAGGRVSNDQLKCRQHLLDIEKNSFNRILIRNRIWILSKCNHRLRAFFDFGRLVFVVKLMFKLPSALSNFGLLFVDLEKHRRHYERIKNRVACYKSGDHG